MTSLLLLLAFKTVSAPESGSGMLGDTGMISIVLLVAILTVGPAILRWLMRRERRQRPVPTARRPARRERRRPPVQSAIRPAILVDGSNVMYWRNNEPQLAPLVAVIERLKAMGYRPGVVFDANAGWKLAGRYLDDDDLADLLVLPRDQVFVVPKGKQADPFLLQIARERKARIVTNDRYRDWEAAFPEVREPGFLIAGGAGGTGVSLKGLAEARSAAS